ncbi:MAG: glycosyltransferase family 4 protein [Candidatus Melainabacteria bacterium]|nr:glycosyltransferase family 4 protein [Candidatus Melainabacteria bacterium]
MRIAQLAPLTESVPPTGYGGTELVVSLLTEELVGFGHDVTLFACADSVTGARLVGTASTGLRLSRQPPHRWAAFDITSLVKLKEMSGEFDVIHNHMGYQALPMLASLNVPSVTTNHNPVKDYCAPVYFAYGSLNYVAISESYRQLNYPERINYCDTIYNGIAVEKYQPSVATERRYLLFVGRIGADKGAREAIEFAGRVGLPLKMAGKVDGADQEYFEKFVLPAVQAGLVDFLGEVGEAEKIALYAGAIAVVYPIRFDEPFGLVMVEAMASGTPVIALDRGSVKELVLDGVTGLVDSTLENLVRRFKDGTFEQIESRACIHRARHHFGKQAMARKYEALYQRVLNTDRLPAGV